MAFFDPGLGYFSSPVTSTKRSLVSRFPLWFFSTGFIILPMYAYKVILSSLLPTLFFLLILLSRQVLKKEIRTCANVGGFSHYFLGRFVQNSPLVPQQDTLMVWQREKPVNAPISGFQFFLNTFPSQFYASS